MRNGYLNIDSKSFGIACVRFVVCKSYLQAFARFVICKSYIDTNDYKTLTAIDNGLPFHPFPSAAKAPPRRPKFMKMFRFFSQKRKLNTSYYKQFVYNYTAVINA